MCNKQLKFTDLIDIDYILQCASEVEADCVEDHELVTDYEHITTLSQKEDLINLMQAWADKHKLNPKH